MKILLITLLPLWLFASQILNYNLYDRTDRVDLMLTFDTPFEGQIRQYQKSGNIIIKLSGVSIESPKVKTLQSPFLSKITITPVGEEVQIIARVPQNIAMQASKTSDAYGLRLRFLHSKKSKNIDKTDSNINLSNLPTKSSSALEENYITVVIILLVGIIIMLWLKRSMAQSAKTTSKPSLFKSGKNLPNQKEPTVMFQKQLDNTNSVMILDYADRSYLVIVGNNNVILDKFEDLKPVTQGEFESILETKKEDIDSFIQLDNIDNVQAHIQDSGGFESYKEKASQ
jgi:hypothetical protein